MANDNVDIISFVQGGLNSDDDLLLLPPGDARYRLNVTVSDDYNFNVLTNTKGNVLKDNSGTFTYPGGTLRVIGFVENKEEKAGIFFVYSSTGEHSIIQYYSETDTLKYILDGGSGGVGALLNFDTGHFIDAGIIGNEEDKYLIWTDGYNEPRTVNILLADNYTNGGSPAYSSPITGELLSFYKRPYLGYVRVFGSSYNSGFTGNNVKGKVFQFSIRLKYYDKTFSPLSIYSNFLSTTAEMPSGRLSDEQANNRVIVQADFDNDLNLVESYQLLFRNIDIGSGVPGNWYIYDTYPYTATGFKTINFYNEKNSGIIPESEVLRYFDYVPQETPHLGIIDSNRVVFGGVSEGRGNVDYADSNEWDVTMSVSEQPIPSIYEGVAYQHDDIIDNGGTNPTNIVFTFSDSTTGDRFYYLNISETPGPTVEQYIFESSFGLDQTDVFTVLRDWVNGLPFDLTAVAAGNNLTVTINGGSANIYFLNMIVLSETPIWHTAKTGATYKYGIVYDFSGKLGYVQTSDDMIVDTPVFGSISSTYTNYYLRIDLTIDHVAPSGATGYRIASFGSNVDYYEQYLVKADFDDITNNSSDITLYTDGVHTIIRRDDMVNRLRAAYGDGIDYGMDIEVGDLVRFVGRFQQTAISGVTYYDTQLFNTNHEYTISSVNPSEIKCSYAAISALDKTLSGTTPIMIEIVRLKGQHGSVAQEFSELFPIDSNGYHASNFQQQTGAQPAIVRITEDFTDCWKSKQVYLNQLNYADYAFAGSGGGFYCWMEKPKVSLYYDSYPTSWGRFNTINENARDGTYNKIRWGGRFLDGSGYNFMSVFNFDDERILDDRNGPINKIQQVGDTLKVYQERKTNSFYLKTTSSTSADGSQTYVFSSNVMSDARQSVFDYGCTHFSGYIKTVRSAYYFDIINGVVIKDTPGGPIEISEQKMHSYFKTKSKDILEYTGGTVLVLGGYDEDLDMYLLTFFDPGNPNDPINETIGYYEPRERWVSFYSYLPEYYGKISGDTALIFCEGKLYLQNANSTRNYFCGSQFTSIVDVHSNGNPNDIKVFSAIKNVSKGSWAPSGDGDIAITLPVGMQSRLLHGKFKNQEGVYHSEFLRDALVTDGSGTTTFKRGQLHNGRALRGLEMRVRLNNSDTGEANLRLVTVKSLISR